ncbi:hypothetical protein LTR47_001553 [Exophiala xenobiotica]|nr:hypothetical protein LTR41_003444 [Exophiala xenobiotica]KAK5224839.1 hypothetical protein LTR72_004620 [Exophiala xenobiotica]KAK5237287.1 hypothetical protein LTR47_001553 [Exophiala xenobiotica]KAK5249233.1 hypothetical protein LTS06_005887 [Exophiala xenobiotica]KAK5293922.1 hypothetical protein LTR14_004813 [Exophiala xenobiotica]
MLLERDVDRAFGSPNSLSPPVFGTVLRSDKMQTILARHEQGTGHMAEGYARATGRPGIALTASGAAFTNMITPIQDALCDGTPMVIFCVQEPRGSALDPGEQVDVLNISESCTKWNVRVDSIEHLPKRITEAFQIATTGRPGPVLVLLPSHISLQTLQRPARFDSFLSQRLYPGGSSVGSGSRDNESNQTLHRIAQLVNTAKKPVLYVGQGMMGHLEGAKVLKEFADKTAIPVTTSLQGLGAFDELDRKALHMLGLHGTAYANLAIQEADLIIALGARFDDRVTGNVAKFGPKALLAAAEGRGGGIVHFDIAPKNIDKVVASIETVTGDCTVNLQRLSRLVNSVTDRPEWFQEIEEWKQRFPLSAYRKVPTSPQGNLIRAQEVIEKLSDMTNDMKDRTIIATGVGQYQMWAAQYFRWRYPRTMITSGGLGSMGYGLPAAIGAKTARPDYIVIDIDGDASFNMTIAELATAAHYGIAVKVLLFNNEQMGMVSDLQRLYYQGRFSQNRQQNPDFVQASQALGVAADRCSRQEDVEKKLQWLLEAKGPAVLEVVTEQNSPVWPVVPAGKGLHEFVTYEEDR